MTEMAGVCGSAETLICVECVCLTWKGLIGLGLPVLLSLIYLPRVIREATVNDWLLMLLLGLLTYASKTVSARGVSHEPWYLYAVVMWSILACSTERMSSMPSIPFVGVMTFLSLLGPDFASMVNHRPPGMYGAPGGAGFADGLIIKPCMAMGLMGLAYCLKVWPLLPNRARRGKVYTRASRQYLLDMSPMYRRPDLEPKLELVATQAELSDAVDDPDRKLISSTPR